MNVMTASQKNQARETMHALKKRIKGSSRKIGWGFTNWDHVLDLLLTGEVKFIIPVCPLYACGDSINDSQLLDNPQVDDILKSRVGGKWKAILDFIDLFDQLNKDLLCDILIHITIVFADLGVISVEPDVQINETLIQHSVVYAKAVEQLNQKYSDLNIYYTTYSQEGVNCSITIHPDENMPQDLINLPQEQQLVEWTKRKLQICNLSWLPKNTKVLCKLVRSFGISLAVGFLYSYCAPDKQLQQLGNIMVNIERGGSVLLQLPYFDLHSFQASAPTIEISVK